MAITPLPVPPQRSDPVNFPTRADAFMTALPTFATEANALQVDVNTQQVNAATSATNAATSASSAATSATNAAGSATAAANTSNAALWVSGTTYALGANVFSPTTFQTYRKSTASSVSTIDPISDGANWVQIGLSVPNSIVRSARTSNTALSVGDNSKLIDITSGTFTQTFVAAATLGNGWWCQIRNSGTGDITLDPNASELIDGLTSFIMYPGEVRTICCDGTALYSIVVKGFSRVFTTTATFTKPPGYDYFTGGMWAAGASGGKANGSGTAANGGSSGGYVPFRLESSLFGATETFTIGAGGVVVTTSNGASNAGGTTSMGSILTITGLSVLGATTASVTSPFTGVGFEGGGTSGTSAKSVYGGQVGGQGATAQSIWGAGAGAGVTGSNTLGAAGTSLFGGQGGASSLASSGTAGTAPGGGGGATQSGTQSGAGARGEIRISGTI